MKNLTAFINQLLPILFAFATLGGVLIFLSACSSSAEYSSAKMDTSLNQKILSLEKEDPTILIQFTGKTNEVINDQMKKELHGTGINIETVVSDIFTANGTVSSIKKTSLLDFVVYLELVKKLDIK
jgi:maltose-binding protein MalE